MKYSEIPIGAQKTTGDVNITLQEHGDNFLLKTLTKTFQFKNEKDVTNNRDVHSTQ